MSERKYLIIDGGRQHGKSIIAKLLSDPQIVEYVATKYGLLNRPTIEQIQEAMRELAKKD